MNEAGEMTMNNTPTPARPSQSTETAIPSLGEFQPHKPPPDESPATLENVTNSTELVVNSKADTEAELNNVKEYDPDKTEMLRRELEDLKERKEDDVSKTADKKEEKAEDKTEAAKEKENKEKEKSRTKFVIDAFAQLMRSILLLIALIRLSISKSMFGGDPYAEDAFSTDELGELPNSAPEGEENDALAVQLKLKKKSWKESIAEIKSNTKKMSFSELFKFAFGVLQDNTAFVQKTDDNESAEPKKKLSFVQRLKNLSKRTTGAVKNMASTSKKT